MLTHHPAGFTAMCVSREGCNVAHTPHRDVAAGEDDAPLLREGCWRSGAVRRAAMVQYCGSRQIPGPFGVVVKIAIFTRRLKRPIRPSYGFKALEPPQGVYRPLELMRGMA